MTKDIHRHTLCSSRGSGVGYRRSRSKRVEICERSASSCLALWKAAKPTACSLGYVSCLRVRSRPIRMQRKDPGRPAEERKETSLPDPRRASMVHNFTEASSRIWKYHSIDRTGEEQGIEETRSTTLLLSWVNKTQTRCRSHFRQRTCGSRTHLRCSWPVNNTQLRYNTYAVAV